MQQRDAAEGRRRRRRRRRKNRRKEEEEEEGGGGGRRRERRERRKRRHELPHLVWEVPWHQGQRVAGPQPGWKHRGQHRPRHTQYM